MADFQLGLEALEDRRLFAVTPLEPVFQDLVSVNVVGRNLFYNNSAFDGNSAAANAADDAAIAVGKAALLPGGTASFANYSSYSRGINGVMVDIAGLPTAKLTSSDFEFRVGNVNDPSSWAVAPAPTSVTVRLGAGVGGSARVEIIWADGAIQKQWLEVTVKAVPNTGLATPDVFYFGNAVGDSGNSASDAIVDNADVQGAQLNPSTNAPLTSAYDYNRDGLVNATDQSIASNNGTNAATALKLVQPVVAPATTPQQREQIDLFAYGDGGYPVIFGTSLVTTKAGTVIAIAEARYIGTDAAAYALVERRSTDGGVTWSPLITVYSVPPGSARIGNVASVVDQLTGKIIVVFNRNNSDVLLTTSSDDGRTWTAPTDISTSVKVTAAGNPGPPGYWANTPWGWYAVGPGHGIQLQNGPYAGRIMIGGDHRITADTSGPSWAQVIYSDDHGVTWKLGGGLAPNTDGSSSPNDGSNESTLVELSNGDVYMSSRMQYSFPNRNGSRSSDGGITWTATTPTTGLTVPKIEGSLLRLNANTLLFSSPNNLNPNDSVRREMSIYVSYDDAATWTLLKTVYFGPSGYSDMTLVGPDTILLAYGKGYTGGAVFSGGGTGGINTATGHKIALARINLNWLQSTDPYQFSWYFNEQAPGQMANTSGTSIQDYGPWDSRASVLIYTGQPAPTYVAGANGDAALRLTSNLDEVVLQQGGIRSLQFKATDSFTAEIVMKTTAAAGVIIGTRPTIANWTLQLVAGKLQFSLNDLTNSSTITSDNAINDGNWHRIVAVRDVANDLLKIYVDGVLAATPVADTTTGSLVTDEPVTLGAYNTRVLSSQLAFDVDTVRVTRAALSPGDFLPANFVNPVPPPAKVYPNTAPPAIPGLQLWLPPYDPARYFNDFGGLADPLPLTPFDGMASRSMLDVSANAYPVTTYDQYHALQYAHDANIGPYWNFKYDGSTGSSLQVNPQTTQVSGTQGFDFVQNTGVFTLSTFVKVGPETGGAMALFDTSQGSTSRPGFNLSRLANGLLSLKVSGGTAGTIRFDGAATDGALAANQWYHIAVVGSGPGQPVRFYVTPITSANVTSYNSAGNLGGPDGTYTASPYLFIGGQTPPSSGPAGAPFSGGMVNQTVFNQALNASQIQQLFDFGKTAVANSSQVVSRLLFYDNSKYDGKVAGVNAGDDNAIAIDKTAYLGQGATASFQNVSSYTRGINGIMIDISGSHPDITAADFTFTVGNNNSPGSWTAGPAPATVTVRAGAGVNGSDRIELIWADGAIQKQWLEVTVADNDRTGLLVPDVFYFGNAPGDTGLGDVLAATVDNANDELSVRNNPKNLLNNIPITNIHDFNRDGAVDAANDELYARNNTTNNLTGTKFLKIGTAPAAPEVVPATLLATHPVVASSDTAANFMAIESTAPPIAATARVVSATARVVTATQPAPPDSGLAAGIAAQTWRSAEFACWSSHTADGLDEQLLELLAAGGRRVTRRR